jgi:putative acetyltransferase
MSTFQPQEFLGRRNKSVLIRSIEASDVKTVKEFLRQVAQETNHTLQYIGRELPTDEVYAKRFEDSNSDPLVLHLGAFDDERLVAYLCIRPTNADHPWARHIATFGMMVLKDYWGQGIGSRFLTIQDEFARSAGFLRIEAQVRTNNDRGVQLYKRMGYAIEGTRKSAALIEGQLIDEYFIARLLDKTERPNHHF